jgi:hypothetical protein
VTQPFNLVCSPAGLCWSFVGSTPRARSHVSSHANNWWRFLAAFAPAPTKMSLEDPSGPLGLALLP